MKNLPLLSSIGSVLLAAAPMSQAVITSYFSDFNSGSGTVTDYTAANGDPAVDFAWDAAAGVGGGGGVLIGSSASNKYYLPDDTSAFDFTTLPSGDGYRVTADFRWSDSTSTDLTVINIGFVPSTGSTMSSTTSMGGSLIRAADGSTVTLRLRTGSTNVDTMSFGQDSLTAGNWYRLTYEVTKSGTANAFNGIVTLYSIGEDGLDAAQVFLDGGTPASVSGSQTNATLYEDGSVISVYDVRNTNGINAVDNLGVSYIPEPSAAAMLGLGALAFGARRRRR